ncbi:ATP-binding protein [Oleiagrimonas sp. MCCC 1A03011]|uniref:sensor histidine kinase n=1 Tax=Oleiagrimonas sp. MCCC 1A03011 TaxID=1926883 RepID=UPI001F0B9958|nr:ATP-binding protein [Oleiagrimonas sp. MCCC 1A03011]
MPTDSTPTPRTRGQMPRFEARVLYGGLLIAAPALLALVGVLTFGLPVARWIVPSALAVLALTAWVARWQYRRVIHPMYTLSSLIEALRQGDYSLRGTRGSVLGDMTDDVNRLAERLQRERLEFEESSYLLSKTLAALDSAVFVFDESRCLRLVNPVGQQLLNAEKHRLFGASAAELGLAALLDAPPIQTITRAFPGRTGRFEVRHAPLRSGGRGGRLLVVNDVGRVLREEERQAWQRLLRVLGHEVNNSLAPIQSMADTLATLAARDPLPDDWREDFRTGLDVIGKRAGALARFLAGYSSLARLPSPNMRDVDLAQLAKKAAHLQQRCPVQVEDGEALRVQADPDQIEQALINLLRNAVEAAPAEGGLVRVRWRREDARALIEVIDNGPGPPRSDNLFVPFFTTKPGGSGIGLALVRQITEAHEGGVSLVARKDARGALARIWLPVG